MGTVGTLVKSGPVAGRSAVRRRTRCSDRLVHHGWHVELVRVGAWCGWRERPGHGVRRILGSIDDRFCWLVAALRPMNPQSMDMHRQTEPHAE